MTFIYYCFKSKSFLFYIDAYPRFSYFSIRKNISCIWFEFAVILSLVEC
jgi:hypothetical protein